MAAEDLAAERLESFKFDLRRLDSLEIVRKNVIYGSCAMLSDDLYLGLRSVVAHKFGLHPNEILIVGSGKLGFSIAPHKRYRPFADTSDVDLVIVSDRLFAKTWESLYQYSEHGGYWERLNEFKTYLFQGWIRPDKLPNSRNFKFANDWWEFFRDLTASHKFGPYKIRAALYMNWTFLESYQLRGVNACRSDAAAGEV